jgi:L-ribulose-5-phosphate 4-epimerase
MVLVAGHGPFTWGTSASNSVYNAAVLEEISKMAFYMMSLQVDVVPLPSYIIKKHYERKHGVNAYYGQK